MYIIARMLLGLGIVFCIISGSAMIGELGYPKERPVLTSLVITYSAFLTFSILNTHLPAQPVGNCDCDAHNLPPEMPISPPLPPPPSRDILINNLGN